MKLCWQTPALFMSHLNLWHFNGLLAHTGVVVEKKGYQWSTAVWTTEENERRQVSDDCHKIIYISEWNSQKSVVITHHRIPVKGSQVHNTHQRWFWLLPINSIIFSSQVCMEAPSPGSPSLPLTKLQCCWWWYSPYEHCEDISGNAQQYFSLVAMRPNSTLLTSLYPSSGRLGNEDEKQYPNPNKATILPTATGKEVNEGRIDDLLRFPGC